MIYVTRLNHVSIVLNSQLIEHIETTPDTVISLTTGEKLRVLESADEIISRVIEFQRKIQDFPSTPVNPASRRDTGETGTAQHG